MEHTASAAVVRTCVTSTSQRTSHLLTLLIQHLTVSQMSLSFHGVKILGKEPSFVVLLNVKPVTFLFLCHRDGKQNRTLPYEVCHTRIPHCSTKNELNTYERTVCVGNCWMQILFSKMISNLVCFAIWMPNFISLWRYSEGFMTSVENRPMVSLTPRYLWKAWPVCLVMNHR